MKILQVILIGCLLLTLAKVAVSQPALDGIQLNTPYLNKHCQAYLDANKQQGFDQGVCIGIILGVEDNASYDKKICVPANVSLKQRVQVINGFIQNNPEKKHLVFASNVFDAILYKWPCVKK
jgi:hypothetical protein